LNLLNNSWCDSKFGLKQFLIIKGKNGIVKYDFACNDFIWIWTQAFFQVECISYENCLLFSTKF
jgi:hypothetical protein